MKARKKYRRAPRRRGSLVAAACALAGCVDTVTIDERPPPTELSLNEARAVNLEFFRFDAKRHDAGTKVIFGKRGTFSWRDSVQLCLHNPHHATFFVGKLWSYFVPFAPSASTRVGLEEIYRSSGYVEVAPFNDERYAHHWFEKVLGDARG